MDSSKAQLRSQLLANETGLPENPQVSTMSAFAAQGRMQHPAMPPIHNPNGPPMADPRMGAPPNNASYSNHDLITPVLESAAHPSGPSSRKASMNSMSMQRLFRRKGNSGGNFDDELGADIGDMANTNMSFNDIAHLRGAGRYNTSAMGNLDTAPIIPVVGMPGSGGAKGLNNVQYRKHMNHQKKLNLAQSARAMSLAGGGNPMVQQDPRSMSFTNAPNTRANSLGTPMNGMGGPNSRAMSLNSNAMFRGPPNGAYYGPGPAMQRPLPGMNGQYAQPHYGPPQNNGSFQNGSFQNGPPQNGSFQNGPAQNGPYMGQQGGQGPPQHNQMSIIGPGSPQFAHQRNPHTMSLRSGASPYNRNGPQDPRSNSLNSAMPMVSAQRQYGQYGQNTQPMMNGAGYPPQKNPMGLGSSVSQNAYQHNGSNPSNPGFEQSQSPHQSSKLPPATEASTDSLMNVLEEDEDEDMAKGSSSVESSHSLLKLGSSANISLPLSVSNSDDEHVYNFENQDSPQISRKSTLKKSNSMRVRKLDLFNTHSRSSLDPGSSKKIIETEDPEQSVIPAELENSENRHSFERPLAGESSESVSKQKTFEDHAVPETAEAARIKVDEGTSASEPVRKTESIKFKNLTRNTVFGMFRRSSAVSQTESDIMPAADGAKKIPEEPKTDTSLPEEVVQTDSLSVNSRGTHSKELSESQSNVSNYSTDAAKKTETNSTQDSIDSLQDRLSKSKISSEKPEDSDSKQDHRDLKRDDRSVLPKVRQKHSVVSSSNSSNDVSNQSPVVRGMSSISRSNSELKMKGLVPSSVLLQADAGDKMTELPEARGEKRKSIQSKSRNLMKRLSLTNSRKSVTEESERIDQNFGSRRISSLPNQKNTRPLVFTKEELAIMTCNQELQSELQLVTSELAFSIKREIALEAKIRSKSRLPDSSDSSKSASTDSLERSKTISELQEKLNKERKLRFISEEHAILAEHGQSPSALKLDYEKNEIYNQLLAKNDMVIQLQDKLDDIAAAQSKDVGNDLVGRFNDLLKENAALKSKLEKSEAETNSHSGSGLYSTKATAEDFYHECDQAAIMSLKTQRDELRDTITKITSSRNVELKVAQEKIKILEAKLEKVNSINSKLSKRMEKSVSSNGSAHFTSGQGGKLQGFSIIAPSKKVLDD